VSRRRPGARIVTALPILVAAIAAAAMAVFSGAQDTRTAGVAKLSLDEARRTMQWDEPAEPVKIAGPLHFVGTRGLAAWLIATAEGHILLNTTMPSGGPAIEASIRKLGFRPEEIRILLTGHAHIDHAGGHAYIQKLSGATVAMMTEEVDLIESGGRSDFHYGAEPEFSYQPVTVDRVLGDGETIVLGGVTLTAYRTAGHTRGATTFALKITEADRDYNVVFPGGTNINPGYRLVKDASYPGIADDYRRTVEYLEMMTPDIWLDMHLDPEDFDARRARAAKEGAAAWVNTEEYREWIAAVRGKLDAALAAQSDAAWLKDLATRYTAAWCSRNAANVAKFFDEKGSLTINYGTPAVGRTQIAAAAQSFMTAFPDIVVTMDGVEFDGGRGIYRWTFTGTNTGPGGTGRAVRISGQEEWSFGPGGLIYASQGRFDEDEYKRQLAGVSGGS